MNIIILTSNDNRKINERISVSNNLLKRIKKLQYIGGFKRFSIDIYDENTQGKTDKVTLVNFLNSCYGTTAFTFDDIVKR